MQAECHLKACSQTRIHGNIGRFTVLGSFLRSGVPTTNQEEAWFRFGGKVGHFLCGQDLDHNLAAASLVKSAVKI